MVPLRPIKTNLPQPDQKFGSPACQDQGGTASFELNIQVTQRIEAVDIDVTDRNRINDKPTYTIPGSICCGQRALLKVIGIEECQGPIEAEQHQPWKGPCGRSVPFYRMKAS